MNSNKKKSGLKKITIAKLKKLKGGEAKTTVTAQSCGVDGTYTEERELTGAGAANNKTVITGTPHK